MAGPTYIKFYPSEWYFATRDLEDSEYANYLRILVEMYIEGDPCIKESVIPRRIGKSKDEWAAIRDTIASYFKVEDGVWYHDRVDGELGDSFALIAKNSKAGKASALARRSKKKAEEAREKAKAKTEKKRGKSDSCTDEPASVGTPVETSVGTPVGTSVSTIREDKTKSDNSKQYKNTNPTPMTTHWMPHKDIAIQLNADFNIPMEFIWPLVPEFRVYWIDRGQHRTPEAWEKTFYNRVKQIWDHEGYNDAEQEQA